MLKTTGVWHLNIQQSISVAVTWKWIRNISVILASWGKVFLENLTYIILMSFPFSLLHVETTSACMKCCILEGEDVGVPSIKGWNPSHSPWRAGMVVVIIPVYKSVLHFLVVSSCSKAPPTSSSTKGAWMWLDLPSCFPRTTKKQQCLH